MENTKDFICQWREDEDGNWGTGCGEMFIFTTDGPIENNFKFCPYCGGQARSVPYKDTEQYTDVVAFAEMVKSTNSLVFDSDNPPRIVALCGKKRAGKSTAAVNLTRQHGFVELTFAETPKRMVEHLLGAVGLHSSDYEDVREEPIPELGGASLRRLWQTLATDWGRHMIHPNIWVWAAVQSLNANLAVGNRRILFSDVRFANEIEFLNALGAKFIYIERAWLPKDDPHESEKIDLPMLMNRANDENISVIENRSTIDSFFQRLGMGLQILFPYGI